MIILSNLQKLPILLYHSISLESDSIANKVSQDLLKLHIKTLLDADYQILPLKKASEILFSQKKTLKSQF